MSVESQYRIELEKYMRERVNFRTHSLIIDDSFEIEFEVKKGGERTFLSSVLIRHFKSKRKISII